MAALKPKAKASTFSDPHAVKITDPSGTHYPTAITVLTSMKHTFEGDTPLMQKKFWIDESGNLSEQTFQHAMLYGVEAPAVNNIHELAGLVERISSDPRKIIIRGHSLTGQIKGVRKKSEEFDEPPQGIPWAMIDFDHIELPPAIDPLSVEAVEYVIAKLPTEFQTVSYYYQFSNSAGIIKPDGTPRKTGFNGHVYFWLDRPIHGKQLTAYLKLHCINTGFYDLAEDSHGYIRPVYGVDLSLINSAVQAHYTAAPDIGEGVNCVLAPDTRQAFVGKASDEVTIPQLPLNITLTAKEFHRQLLDSYKKSLGHVRVLTQSKVGRSIASIWHYANPSSNPTMGRDLVRGSTSADGKYLTLYLSGENSPGSWYVDKTRPEFARHYGGDVALLKDLSPSAHAYVRDELKWFVEIPQQRLSLTEQGYLPKLSDFAHAKASLILAPTGSGKTRAAIDWCKERLKVNALVIYAAPTIALIDQMIVDVAAARMPYKRYDDVWTDSLPDREVIITTNQSLGRILRMVYEANLPHYLILDEIHMGLDEFMNSTPMNKIFEDAISKATQTLLLTGTLTDVQRTKLPELAGHALSGLTQAHYCTYEFAPVKRNPLFIRPTNFFDGDFVLLMESLAAKRAAGESLPRVMILLDTSKLDAFRKILEKLDLTDLSHVVSRKENTPDEVKAAQRSTLPILIASPLFALGLNFDREPEYLLCRFSGISADTSQIIQAVNRANRNTVKCETYIYGNPVEDLNFHVQNFERLKVDVVTKLKSEASLTGLLEDHLHVDRVGYQVLRACERNSLVALSYLVDHDLIQNYTVTAEAVQPKLNRKKGKIFKAQKKASSKKYLDDISEQAARFSGYESFHCFWKLEQLAEEKSIRKPVITPRTGLEIENEEHGVIMVLCGLTDPQAAKKVSVIKVRRLFGELPPWTSDQYSKEKFDLWGRVEAEKSEKLVVLLRKLHELKTGEIDVYKLLASLSRNKKLVDAFLALSSKDYEFISKLPAQFEAYKKSREFASTLGSKTARESVQKEGLIFLHDLLGELGVAYGKVFSDELNRLVIDYENPVVPANWNLEAMAFNLLRQAMRLRALPIDQKVAVVSEDEYDRLHPDEPIVEYALRLCRGCTYFHESSCVKGRRIDWQGSGGEVVCPEFRQAKFPLSA